MNNDTLKDAVIEAARHLVRKHVESEIVADKDNTYLRLLIRPTKAQSFGRYLLEDDESDNLFTALADLLGAVDSYDEWRAESDNT